ncbi:MAG: L,D-transpeptidase [Cyanobacteria bacterium J06598_1]
MRRQPPIVRCFGLLCVISAATLVALEWRNPFPDPVVTPGSPISISEAGLASAQAAEASPAEADVSGQPATRSVWDTASGSKPAAETPVQLELSLDGRYLDVVVPMKPTLRYEVAVGQDDWKTPTGTFAVMSKLESPAWLHPITKEEIPPGPDNPLGDRWIGFWSNGEAQIGFHGTNQEDLIGEAVSHGCVRMRNRDIKKLYELVEIGTPVEVSLQ